MAEPIWRGGKNSRKRQGNVSEKVGVWLERREEVGGEALEGGCTLSEVSLWLVRAAERWGKPLNVMARADVD